MSIFRQFRNRTRAFCHKEILENELDEEIRLHLEHLITANVANGMLPEDARYAAQRQFGGAEQFKEQCRDSLGWRVIDEILRDLRFAARGLRKNLGFTAVALSTLALCIGANTAIFSTIYTLILKPLPFPAPNRLVEVYNSFPKGGFDKMGSDPVQYADYKTNTVSYEALGLWATTSSMLGEEGAEERITEAHCTAEMFNILGVKPILGNFFTLQNNRPGEDKVIVLMQSYWEAHCNKDLDILGKSMRVDGESYRIIGVAPRALEAFDPQAKFIEPMTWKPQAMRPIMRFAISTPLFARLKPGVSVASAVAEASAVEQRYYDSSPPLVKEFIERSGHKVGIGLVQSERAKPIKASLYLLQGGALFVLLIGCLNIANLLLARANSRLSELAIRSALGATRTAIAFQLLVESLMLTLAGALLGVGLAWWVVRAANQISARMLPAMPPIVIDRGALWGAVLFSVTVGLVIGLMPVVHILRINLVELIHRSSRGASGGRNVRRLSSALVTGQVAVATILLSGAGLLVHSFARAAATDTGFDSRNVVTCRIVLPALYRDQKQSTAFQQRLLEGLTEIPGVESAALATSIPFQGRAPVRALTLKEGTVPRDSSQPGAYQIGVSVGYFQALHIQLLHGRFFDPIDTLQGRQTYVVDEHFEQFYFPGRSAVGCHFDFDGPQAKDSDWPVIVGVVRNVPQNGIEDRSNIPFVYYPVLETHPDGFCIFLRSIRPISDVILTLREKLRSIDPAIQLFDAETLQEDIDQSFYNRRTVMLLLGGFALLALFLSAIGIYGVLAYDVSQRTREIGIRGAIGASRPQLVGLIMRQGLQKTGIGLVLGLALAMALSRYMATLLFELKPSDPWTYIMVSTLLAVIAGIASYLPALRALKIAPVEALRAE